MKWVPVSFCQLCIEERVCKAGQLYCFLKSEYESDGILAYSDAITRAQEFFNVSRRSIRRWFNKTTEYNWTGRHNNRLFIRGWQYLFDHHKFVKKACYSFTSDDLINFKTYCYAAVINYMAIAQVKELEQQGRYRDRCSDQAPSWVPMASSAIAKALNVPESTAQTYRNRAVNLGYIKKRFNTKPVRLHVDELQKFKKLVPKYSKNLIVKNGRVFKQLPDEVLVKTNNVHAPRRYHLRIKY